MSIVVPVTAAAPAPIRRRAFTAARLRWIARVSAGLVVAAWSLLLLAWLTLHWGILPHIEQWRPQIEQQASRVLGVPLRIGNISVRSGGWMPALELRDVVLHDAQQRPALELPRVVAALSARSLFAFELHFEQLLIDGAHLEVRRDARGHVFVAGIDFSGPGGGSDNRAANWFFKQHEFVIVSGDPTGTTGDEAGRVSEANHVGGADGPEIGNINPGQTKTVTVDLPPGTYTAMCNLPGHFAAGMVFKFVVQ